MELKLDQALQKGVEAHKAGKVQEADRYYTAILKANPKHPDANHNMGVLAVGVGKVEESLPFFKTAVEVNPNIAQYWLSYIDALLKLGRHADAKAVFDQAKSKGVKGVGFEKLEKNIYRIGIDTNTNHNLEENQLKSLMTLYNEGRFDKVFEQAQKLTGRHPKNLNFWNLLGTSAAQTNRLDQALLAFQEAINIEPDYSQAYNNMGIVLKDQGKLKEALEAYRKAISIRADYAEAYNNIGIVLKDQGKLEEALKAYCKAISIKPDYAEAYYNTGNVLTGITFKEPNKYLQKIITLFLDRQTSVRPKDIARAAISLLKCEPSLQKHLQAPDSKSIENPLDIISDLIELPLLLKLMIFCPLLDLELETLLKNLRRAILSSILETRDATTELLSFQSALALQCFTSEYIYTSTDEEKKVLNSLEVYLKKALKNKEQPSPQVILALASYQSLNDYDWCNLLVVTDDILEVYTRQVEEPQKEKALKSCFPVVGKITDIVSSKVRIQYEGSPYPRWVNLALPVMPKLISQVVHETNLRLEDYKIYEVKVPEILIAGCGTGQHSIETASRFKSSKVLAVDLSRSSLAYAKRKTEELNIENINYMQADILNLGQLNRQFNIIESAGVLHHMENPLAGWKVLTDCLKPGGLMQIGLYSELARQHIVKIREEIKQLGIGSSDREIRSFRDTVVRSGKDHHKRIVRSLDFYSLSELRDLLFHVQEHRFTIPKIKDHLDELGLNFCGFQSKKIVSRFKLTFRQKDDPFNLDKWQIYEEANPRVFAGMYQFWCQKNK